MEYDKNTFIKCQSISEFEALRRIFYFRRVDPMGLSEDDYRKFSYSVSGDNYFFPDELETEFPDHKILPAKQFIEENMIDWSPDFGDRIEVSDDYVNSEIGSLALYYLDEKGEGEVWVFIGTKEEFEHSDGKGQDIRKYARPLL